jgi:hypothetical protein
MKNKEWNDLKDSKNGLDEESKYLILNDWNIERMATIGIIKVLRQQLKDMDSIVGSKSVEIYKELDKFFKTIGD